MIQQYCARCLMMCLPPPELLRYCDPKSQALLFCRCSKPLPYTLRIALSADKSCWLIGLVSGPTRTPVPRIFAEAFSEQEVTP
jgi:hypothetical protein